MKATMTRKDILKLYEKTEMDSATGCWRWTGSRSPKGYGYFYAQGRRSSMVAHRASWIINHGDIPEGLLVCHKCDVRDCINPDHLFLGTALDNARDAKSKGRLGGRIDRPALTG